MNISNRIARLNKRSKMIEAKKRVKFFNSHAKFEEAKYNNMINDNDICFIDDIPPDTELIKKGHLIIHHDG